MDHPRGLIARRDSFHARLNMGRLNMGRLNMGRLNMGRLNMARFSTAISAQRIHP